ncbi:hypothetical protein J0H33_07015 [bacterium]|nr:hypothetical protein [bacterium]
MAAGGLVAYLDYRPNQAWILWLTAGLVALAVDGIVRTNPEWDDEGPFASLIYLFLPVLGTLGAGFFIDHAIDGYARGICGVVAAIAIGVVAYGEYQTVDVESRSYGAMRLLLAIATYLTAFALFAVIYTGGLHLPVAALCVAIVSLMLSIELLRESRLSVHSALSVGLAVGMAVGELRLALYFFPLDGLLAGALLIIGFYLATGLVHHLLDHDLEWGTLSEYLLVAAVGTAAVVFTRVFV